MSAQVRKPAQRLRRRRDDPAPQADAALPDDRQVQVALAAYFIAQKRGFEPGHELDDWLAAEAQIAAAEQPSVSKPIRTPQVESLS